MVSRKMEERAQLLQQTLATQAQARFVKWVIKDVKEEEGTDIDYDTAWAICNGQAIDEETGKPEFEYMLGFKLADPVLQIALFKQRKADARRQAAANFAAGLSDEEKDLFYSKVFNEETAGSWKKAYREEKKKAKKGKSD